MALKKMEPIATGCDNILALLRAVTVKALGI